jgi:hypothetical protein
VCFSTTASFVASGVLAIAGIVSVGAVKEKRLIPLALIPFFFAVQQFAEGVVWIDIEGALIAKNIFLFFAYIFWPLWIPFSLFFVEPVPLRRQLIAITLGVGLVVASSLSLVVSSSEVVKVGRHLCYSCEGSCDTFSFAAIIFYALATLPPFFISTIKKIWIVGFLLTLTGLVVYMVNPCFASLWCFGAAVISLGLCWILKKK